MMRSDAPIRQFMSEKGEYYKAKFAPFAAISATAAAQSNQVLGTAGQIINMINEYSQPQEPAGAVLNAEVVDIEAHFAKCGGCRCAGKTCAHDNDVEVALVGGIHQVLVGFIAR